MTLVAIQHLRRMRGGAQSHLMRCNDGNFYVVKFCNNPQHLRVLANEFIASRLARHIGLPVPPVEIIEVGNFLVEHTPDLYMEVAGQRIECQPGLNCGSRYVISPLDGTVFDYFPKSSLCNIRSLDPFLGILAFDKWTGNSDGRQAVFFKKTQEKKYSVAFIDQGNCFNAGDWSFLDSPQRGLYCHSEVYANVRGWQSFQPWLGAIETMKEDFIWDVAGSVPPEWYGSHWGELEDLMRRLIARRDTVRELIGLTRDFPRAPFVNCVLKMPPESRRISLF